MPQIIYSSGIVLINDLLGENSYTNNIYIKLLSMIGLNYFIKSNYINEINESVIFRVTHIVFSH